jgi:GT2 family glycosyltransferase
MSTTFKYSSLIIINQNRGTLIENILEKFISVVILNYNGRAFLKECLDSISCQSIHNYEIILADNNSKDGSVDFVKNSYPHVKVIEFDENYGFAKGNNIGIQNSKGRYVILLNNDTRVERNFIKVLYSEITSRPNCGLVDTWLYDGKNLPTRNATGGLSMLGYGLSGKIFDIEPNHFLIAGCAFIIDRDKIPVPFDDDYFLFYEDNYVSWLNKLKGFDAFITFNTLVLHYGSGSSGRRSRIKVFYGERNRIMNLILFYSSSTLIKLLPIILLNMAIAPLRALLIYKRETYVGEYLKGYLWILRHFGNVMEKRRKIQVQRRVSDEEILKHFTYKITDGRYNNVLNSIAKIYCITVRIKTFDL